MLVLANKKDIQTSFVYWNFGISHQLMEFITPHVFEIGSITIAGVILEDFQEDGLNVLSQFIRFLRLVVSRFVEATIADYFSHHFVTRVSSHVTVFSLQS